MRYCRQRVVRRQKSSMGSNSLVDVSQSSKLKTTMGEDNSSPDIHHSELKKIRFAPLLVMSGST